MKDIRARREMKHVTPPSRRSRQLVERRSRVIAIRGATSPDVITKGDLNQCANLQAAAWLADRAAQLAAERLHVRIMQGASVEDSTLFFDSELKMVSSKH